jgi:hypothetical protein
VLGTLHGLEMDLARYRGSARHRHTAIIWVVWKS